MGDMLKFLVLACFVVLCAKGDYTVQCNNDSNFETNMSFEPSQDRVKGRYTVVLCTDADENVTEWETMIRFNESIKSEQCNGTYFKQIRRKIRKLWPIHSSSRQNVNFDLACTNACFTTSLDLVFEACYIIESILYRGHQSSIPQKIFHYVTNDFPNNTLLLKYTPKVTTTEYKDYVSLNWYIGPIPGVAFKMTLCELTTTEHPEHCEDVTQNCTVPEMYRIHCRLSPGRGSFSMDLDHYAPWATNIANNKFHWKFRLDGVEEVAVSGGRVWTWAAVALALAALAALLAWRASPQRPSPAKQRRVLDAWTSSEMAAEGTAEEAGVRVVVLYARDCGAMMEVVARLKAALGALLPGGVLDVFAPDTVAAAAPAPLDWLRALLAAPTTRVLLLQTPAAACLLPAQERWHGAALAMHRPLLGGRVVPRVPHASDALLQLALRLACQHAALPQQLPYRKYFVLEIPGLEAELVPLVTPQRRYLLPQGLAPLLQDLAPGSPRMQQALDLHLQPLQRAVDDLLRYVAEHPDYLDDHLLFL